MQSLWNYAVALYAQPGVQAACLELQDEHGLDVNLLLFSAWSAAQGPGLLDIAAIRDCESRVAACRTELIEPLRQLRRACRAGTAGLTSDQLGSLGEQLLAAELAAERAELELLADWAGDRARHDAGLDRAAMAASNLVACLAAGGVSPATVAASTKVLLAGAAALEINPV